jgi:hypothetical protein
MSEVLAELAKVPTGTFAGWGKTVIAPSAYALGTFAENVGFSTLSPFR